jgi:DNA uptake protein ComE-like DNA-binding protein
VLDVNTATALEFVVALNFDGVRAQALVEARRARGGFAGIEDFAATAELVPYELEALRSRLVCGPVDRI